MTSELTVPERQAAHAIPVWAVVRVVPAASETKVVSHHLTQASAREDQERRGGPPGDETEGFEVRAATLLAAFEFGTFSIEEVRRQIERETGPLEPEEEALAARTALWTVWYEDRFGYGEDRDPAIPVAHFFTKEEAESFAAKQGGPPTAEAFTGHTVTRGTLLDAVTQRILPVNAKARELLAALPPEIEERMFERVCAFLVKEAGVAREALAPEASLVDDLGIRGREGARVMAAFFEDFEVSPGAFQVTRYFSADKLGLLGTLSTLMRDDAQRRALSVDDLVGAALAGRWLG